jgi:hypothetical protein
MQRVSASITEARKNVEAEYEIFEAEWGPRLLALQLRTGFQIFFALFASVIRIGTAIMILPDLN